MLDENRFLVSVAIAQLAFWTLLVFLVLFLSFVTPASLDCSFALFQVYLRVTFVTIGIFLVLLWRI